jgi:hypothetical protein
VGLLEQDDTVEIGRLNEFVRFRHPERPPTITEVELGVREKTSDMTSEARRAADTLASAVLLRHGGRLNEERRTGPFVSDADRLQRVAFIEGIRQMPPSTGLQSTACT